MHARKPTMSACSVSPALYDAQTGLIPCRVCVGSLEVELCACMSLGAVVALVGYT
jgi:hypothetical protein